MPETATISGEVTAERDVSRRLLIGGQLLEADRTFPSLNPATGEVITSVPDGNADDALEALRRAAAAQSDWAATSPRSRSEILYRAYELITARADEFATLMTTEMGKPYPEARGEVAYGAEFFRWFAEEAVRIGGDSTTTGDGSHRVVVTRQPVGPCILITPWNFPLAMATRKIAPALAAGCTVVIRPASATPLTTLLFAKTLVDAGLPAGVVNVITGRDHAVTDAILEDPRLRKLSFTGSTGVGANLLGKAAKHVLRTSMELGGNAPFFYRF